MQTARTVFTEVKKEERYTLRLSFLLSVFFHILGAALQRASLLLFFPRIGLQRFGGFLFYFVFEMERELDEENFFPSLLRPHFLFGGNGERESEEKTD